MRDLMAIGFLRVAMNVDLTLNDAARFVVQYELEELAALTVRHGVIDNHSGVIVLLVPSQNRTADM